MRRLRIYLSAGVVVAVCIGLVFGSALGTAALAMSLPMSIFIWAIAEKGQHSEKP
ncbi:MAG: hypothetical protein O2904_02865 [bacterium]|nr:hypothetical protein [bacterium]